MCLHRSRFLLANQFLHAGATDRALFQQEQAFASAKEEHDFFMTSLQTLTLFKSKSERALLDVQSRAEGAQREAQQARQRYEQVLAARVLPGRPASTPSSPTLSTLTGPCCFGWVLVRPQAGCTQPWPADPACAVLS
jgi:hypothetical protein